MALSVSSAVRQIVGRHFSAATLRSLDRKGVTIYGTCTIPGSGDLPWATGETGYKVSDNGCGRIWTFAEVLAAAA